MLTTKAQLEHKTANGEPIHLTCGSNVPVTEVIGALKTFLTYSYGLLKQQEDQQKGSSDGCESKPEGDCCP